MVVATDEDNLIRFGNMLYVNSYFKGYFLEEDSLGNPLPQLSAEDLQPYKGEIFVMGTHFRSFDSRYFGSIKRDDVKATARLLIKF